jgi:fermentation-respiration switch protein FrsA (DUF1100 family)
MIRSLLSLGLLLLGLYLAMLVLLFVVQRSLLFPGSDRRATAEEAGLAGFEDIALATADGERIAAWWKPPRPGKAVILYFHGNGGSLWDRRFRAAVLTREGRGLLMVSYRGYSGSTGRPSEEALHRDALAAYDWVARSYEASRLVVYGESLGTGVAVRLATERRLAGVILDAPFTSTVDVASAVYWYMPVAWLMRDPFRSIDIVAEIGAPLLILHGEQDGVIPIGLGERLYAAAAEPKQFVRLAGVGHATVLEGGGLQPVDAFLAAVEARIPSPQDAASSRSQPAAQP